MRELTGIGLTSEADFLRRSNNRTLSRQKRIKIIKIKGVHIFLMVTLLVMLAFVISKTGHFLLTWEKLEIQSFQLINPPDVQGDQVKNIIQHYRGNIISFNFDKLREELKSVQQVKQVSMSKILPSTIEIHFELRRPMFQVKTPDTYKVYDDEGVFLYDSDTRAPELLTAKGPGGKDLLQIERLIPELLRIKNTIDYIDLERPDMVMVKLKGFNEVFIPGESAFVDKIAQYMKVKKKLSNRLKGKKVKCVDLRFENRFYLEFDEEVNS